MNHRTITRAIAGALLLVLLFTSAVPEPAVAKLLPLPPVDNSSLFASSVGSGITGPPYSSSPGTWTHELAGGEAWARANYQTGFISATAFSYLGGASAQADQWMTIDIPSGQISEVTVVANLIYLGGSKKNGISASSWGGSDKVWYVGSQEYKEELEPVFSLGNVIQAVIDFGLTIAPLAGTLAKLEETSKIMKIIDTLNTIKDVYGIVSDFKDLLAAGKAKSTTIAFSFTASQATKVGMGVRVDTSGCLAGNCFTIVAGVIDQVFVSVRPVTANSYLNFDSWTGYSADIIDNSGSNHKGIPNGPMPAFHGKSGAGIYFDGDRDWVKLDFSSNEKSVLAQQGTVEFWVKPDQVAETICFYGGSGSNTDGLGPDKEIQIGTDAYGRFNFYLGSYAANGFWKWASFGSYTPGTWTHVAVSYINMPAGRVAFYLNGQRTTPYGYYCSNEQSYANLTVDDILLGGPNAPRNFFKGSMDEVRVFSRILSDRDILTHCWQGIDVTAPSIPVVVTEPAFSPGTENYIACNPVSDSESGVSQYYFEISQSGSAASGIWTASPFRLFQGLTNGVNYSYRVKVKDRIGNESDWSVPVTSTQDNTLPDVTFASANVVGQVHAGLITFTLPISISDSGSGISQISTADTIPVDQFLSAPYPASISSIQLTIPQSDGPFYTGSTQSSISGEAIDAVGNRSYFSADMVKIDYEQPQGSITIKNGADYTNDNLVDLNLTYFHPPRDGFSKNGSPYFFVSGVKFSNDNSTWSDWINPNNTTAKATGNGYSSTYSGWSLSSGYGYKTVYAQFKDGAGHLSPVYSDTIGYGAVPSGQITINNGAYWTTDTIVTLNLNSPNATQMAFWNENENPPTAYNWVPCTATYPWNFTSTNGIKTVYVRFKDSIGQQTPNYSASIHLDRDALTGSLSINNGNPATNAINVTLNTSISTTYSGNPEMRFSNGSSWSEWESFKTSRDWQLTPGEGVKTVSVQFRNAAGRTSSSSALITFHQVPPFGTFSVNSGAAFTGTTTVSLRAHVSGDKYSVPEQTTSKQGDRGWYYYKAKDIKTFEALVWDNIVSPNKDKVPSCWNDKLGADGVAYLKVTGPDQGGIIQTGDGGDQAFNNVAIKWSADEDKKVGVVGELWAKSTGSNPDDSGKDDGVYFSVYCKTKNTGESKLISKSVINILHDSDKSYGIQEVPELAVKPGDEIIFYIDCGKSCDNDQVNYNFSITDSSEVAPCSVRFANLLPQNINSATNISEALWWQTLTGVSWSGWQSCNMDYQDTGWTLPNGDGPKTVIAQFQDGAGNLSTPLKVGITLDQTPPVIQSLVINNGTQETNSPDARLAISAADSASGISQMLISDPSSAGSWKAYNRNPVWQISQLGECRITVQVKDVVGNTSEAVQATIVYSLPSSDASLSNLTIRAANLAPAFAPSTLNYTSSVASSTTSIAVTPTANQSQATVTVNAIAVASGTPSGPIKLNTGVNTITILVTAGDKTARTYTIMVTRLASGTVVPVLTPNSPTNLSISAISGSQTRLTWRDNSTNETGFEIYRQEMNVQGVANKLVGSVKPNVTTFADAGLTPGSSYNYQVYAVSAASRSDFYAGAQITMPAK
jgi:hypothetical protein